LRAPQVGYLLGTLQEALMLRDLRFALRGILQNKIFALTALLAFTLGIGATATVFSVIDAVLLRPAQFPNPSSVVRIQSAESKQDWDSLPVWTFVQVRSRSDLFPGTSRFSQCSVHRTRVPVPDQVFGQTVTGNLFPMLEAKPLLGRVLHPGDERSGAPAVALLSYKGWQKLFAADPAILGRTAQIDGEVYTIVGVMPRDFVMPGPSSVLWTTLRLSAE